MGYGDQSDTKWPTAHTELKSLIVEVKIKIKKFKSFNLKFFTYCLREN